MHTPHLAAQVANRLMPLTTGPGRCPNGPQVTHWRCAWDAGWNSAPAHGGFAIGSLLLLLVAAVAVVLLIRAAARVLRGARR
jgi:hypothetical protein